MVQCHINIHLCAHMASNTYSFMTKSLFVFIDTSKQSKIVAFTQTNKNKNVFFCGEQ